jgi:hypothetical protein
MTHLDPNSIRVPDDDYESRREHLFLLIIQANKSLDALKISHIFYFISLYIFRPDNKIVLYKLLYICVYTIMTGVRIFIEDGSGA